MIDNAQSEIFRKDDLMINNFQIKAFAQII